MTTRKDKFEDKTYYVCRRRGSYVPNFPKNYNHQGRCAMFRKIRRKENTCWKKNAEKEDVSVTMEHSDNKVDRKSVDSGQMVRSRRRLVVLKFFSKQWKR